MKKKLFTLIALTCVAFAAFAYFADINGKWTGKFNFQGQDLPVTCNFKTDGEKLTGTSETPYGVTEIQNGKIKDDQFSFTINVQGQDIPNSGKVYADSVGLDVIVQGTTYHAKLTRAQ